MLFLCELIDTVEPFIMHVRRNLPFVSVSFIGTMPSRVLNFLDDDSMPATRYSTSISRTNPALVAESSDLARRPGDDGDLFGKAISRAGINRYRRDIGALRSRRRRVDSHEYLVM